MRNIMTIDEAYDFFVKKVVEGMLYLNQAKNENHIGSIHDYSKKIGYDGVISLHESKELFLDRSWLADNKYFQKVVDKDGDYYGITYQLKPYTDASEALEQLFRGDFTIIECHSAIDICYYYAIKCLLFEAKGEEEGTKYFNELFGSKLDLIPEGRRLLVGIKNEINLKYLSTTTSEEIIKNLDLKNGVQNLEQYPLNVLSFFTTFQFYDKSNEQIGNRNIPSGFVVGFMNSDIYMLKHNIVGPAQSYNVIFYKKAADGLDDLYCGFGFNALTTEKRIIDELKTCHNSEPSNLAEFMRKEYSGDVRYSNDVIKKFFEQNNLKWIITKKDIPGIQETIFGFDKCKLHYLLTKTSKELSDLIDNDLKEQIEICSRRKDYLETAQARIKYHLHISKDEFGAGSGLVFLSILKNSLLTAKHYAIKPEEIEICTQLFNIAASSNESNKVYNNLRIQLNAGGELNGKIKQAASPLLLSLKAALINYLKEYANIRNSEYVKNKVNSNQGLSKNESSMFSGGVATSTVKSTVSDTPKLL